MLKWMVIGSGGIGGVFLRYWISGKVMETSQSLFPLGTLVVNVAGSFIAGLLWPIFEYYTFSPFWRLFIFTGFLGAFTTFSTFNLENLHLIKDYQLKFFAWNIILNNILGLAAVYAGYVLGRILTK